MTDLIKTIWGQTKLARAILAVGCLAFSGVAILQSIDVPTWFQTMSTTAVLSYFVARSDGTNGTGSANGSNGSGGSSS